ncbi:MAG: hypothetical protein K8S98_04780 [Planctomycetes bacterium]|nr:hypothetical protein [Planctomycetota bacterium]
MIAMLGARGMVFLLAGLFLLALLVLGGLAFAAIKILGKRQGGETLAGVTGCAIAAGLGCLGLCVLLGFGVIAAFVFAARVADRAIDHLPTGRWRLEHHDTFPPAAPWNDHARLVFRAEGEHVDYHPLLAIVREVVGRDALSSTSIEHDVGGTAVTEISIQISGDGDELQRIDDELEARTAGFQLPDGTEVEYLGVRRDV